MSVSTPDAVHEAVASGTFERLARIIALGLAGYTLLRLTFVGVAAYQAYLGLSRKFLSYTKTQYMSPPTLRRFTGLGVIGHLARAVTFGLVGVFLVKAALEYDPSEVVGIDGALQRLTTEPYGPAALLVVAVGLIAFGVYSVVDARYRAI